MSFQQAVQTVLNKYADFTGRARRSEYWWWVLAVLLAYIVALIIRAVSSPIGLILEFLIFVATIVPSLAVACRRLHDTGKSGWLQLLAIIPIVGGIVLLVFYVQGSHAGPNQYGPNPKATETGYGYGAPA